MEYAEWAPHYRQILTEFRFSFEKEELAARALVQLLPDISRVDPLPHLRPLFQNREVIVVGLAPRAGAPPIWKLPDTGRLPVLVAADGAAARCLDGGLVPDVVVTDLDGPVPSEVLSNAHGAKVVVHAHGDNVDALRRWVPEFSGGLYGSWAGAPRDGLLDVGGFTDGDRSVFLAEHLGASRILLYGFDFRHVAEEEESERETKLAKLRWASELITLLGKQSPTPILWWSMDGSLSRYAPSTTGPSTQ